MFESAIVSKDVVNIVDADVQFHDTIYAMTDNDRLIQIINKLREQMYRYRLEYVKDARTHSILINEHNDIIQKLADKVQRCLCVSIYVIRKKVLSDF